jgi:NAD+ diphosphatase
MQQDSNPLKARPLLAYAGSGLERASEKRSGSAFIAAASNHPDARVYVLGGELVVLTRRDGKIDPLFTLAEAKALGPTIDSVLIGLAGEAARVGHGLAPETAEALKERPDLLVTDLRGVAAEGLLAPEHLPAIATAKAVLSWHARHRFCSTCGAPTLSVEAGWRRDCGACGAQHFPRTDPVVIMLAIDGERCLIARQSRFPQRMWSCLAGFVEPGETIEEAVRRETREEAGVVVNRVVYFASQPWPYPSSLMIGCHAEAIATELTIDRKEIEDARWVEREEARLMLTRRHPERLFVPPPVAIAHHIIRAYVEHGAAILET